VSSAVFVGFAGGGVARAQSSHLFTDLQPSQKAEVADFINHYAFFVENGQLSPGASTFSYSNSDMNDVLFSPYIAYLRTLASIYGDEGDGYVGDDVTLEMIVEYANFGKITTSTSDPISTVKHVQAIQESNSPVDGGGGQLNSYGVPSSAVAGDGVFYVSPEPAPAPEQWMADLHIHTTGVVSNFDHTSDVQNWLSGNPTNVEQLASDIKSWLEYFVDDDLADAYPLHAVFGKYGAMPYVVTTYSEGYLVTSSITGTTLGPYHPDDELNPTPLLEELPEFTVGTNVSNIDLSNVTVNVVIAREKTTIAPAGYVPDPSCTPAGCWRPRVGAVAAYGCQPIGRKCKCKASGNMTSTATPPGPDIPTDMICITPTDPDGTCPEYNRSAVPPAPIPGADCTQWYYYVR
tara:strand:+ start:256 stop:1467 length:1212 start_codon:yes stop_codon:yes gene_type:complete